MCERVATKLHERMAAEMCPDTRAADYVCMNGWPLNYMSGWPLKCMSGWQLNCMSGWPLKRTMLRYQCSKLRVHEQLAVPTLSTIATRTEILFPKASYAQIHEG